jgi:hypothetical protein
MANYVKDIDKGYAAIMREIKRADDMVVDVGIFQGEVAEYATYNEYGTREIPSRPFMAMSFDENVSKITNDARAGMRRITSGASTVDRELNIIGMKHQNRVQAKIRQGVPPPNAPSTIAKKGSAKTLVDTGVMLNSVTYSVRRK